MVTPAETPATTVMSIPESMESMERLWASHQLLLEKQISRQVLSGTDTFLSSELSIELAIADALFTGNSVSNWTFDAGDSGLLTLASMTTTNTTKRTLVFTGTPITGGKFTIKANASAITDGIESAELEITISAGTHAISIPTTCPKGATPSIVVSVANTTFDPVESQVVANWTFTDNVDPSGLTGITSATYSASTGKVTLLMAGTATATKKFKLIAEALALTANTDSTEVEFTIAT